MRDLGDIDIDSLPQLRLDRQIQSFVAKVERTAGRGSHFVGLDGDGPIDVGDAVAKRQANHGAVQLGRCVNVAEWIDGFRQAIERGIELALGVAKGSGPDNRRKGSAGAARPAPRRRAVRRKVGVD